MRPEAHLALTLSGCQREKEALNLPGLALLWWDRECWWWVLISLLQERGRMWLTLTSCAVGSQGTQGETLQQA